MKKILSILSLGIVGIDLLVKHWTETTLALGESIQVIPGFFELTYVRNFGAAWSMLSGKQWVFLIVTPIVLVVVLYYFFKKESNPLTLAALALVFAGALGNFIDRLYLGFVRDMFAFNIFGYNFPVFNVADMAVVLGVFLLLIVVIRDEVR